MNIPLELRLALLAVLGAALGSIVNLAAYRLAWHQRSLSPWSAPLENAPPRHWSDRIPIVGWLGLRREASLHGAGFWIRPMLVEMFTAGGLAALYWWEVNQLGLLRPAIEPPSELVRHVQFSVHAFLLMLMLAGSLIDVDEKTIPDAITVPGTLAGLVLAAILPWGLLPDISHSVPVGNAQITWDFLRLTSPNLWPQWLDGFPERNSLVIAIGCWWGWCFALMPRTWYGRHGWKRALELSLARLQREPATYRAATMAVLGAILITGVWWLGGDEYWQGLLTSLVGMAAGGGIIWAVRIVGTAVLHREAMGFGDVTLMAMIGAFLGWQACLIIFFLAPFAGLLVGVFSLIVHRESEIPYGPFLCLATAFVMVRWCSVWLWAEPLFGLGGIIAAIFAVGLLLMAGLLGVWRAVFG